MAQLFQPRANLIARGGILLAALLIATGTLAAYGYFRSSYVRGVEVPIDQPVPFSHAHHVAGLGIDCRYCHSSVETSDFAGMPSTQTCMNCHSQIWTNAELLAPVRESWQTDQPIRWRRVTDVPDFVYFSHAIHIAKGIGCETCHGRVDQMPLMQKAHPMYMSWCLQCHRQPQRYIRPREEVFTMGWQPPRNVDRQAYGQQLVEQYNVQVQGLTDCSICHR